MTDTPHEHDPELDRLASGYVDGDVSTDERARIDADPQALARVERFRDHRQHLLTASEFPEAALGRDTAVATALTEFDRLRATARPATSKVLRWQPNTAQRVLAFAAAVVALGVVGANVLGTTRDDTSTTALSVAAEKAASSADAAGTNATDAAPLDTIGAINAPATAAVTISDPSGLLALVDQYGVTVADASNVNVNYDVTRVEQQSPCVNDGDTFLSDVIYQGALGVAVVAADGHARILDATCTVLLDVVP